MYRRANENLKKVLKTLTILDGEGSFSVRDAEDWGKTVYIAFAHEGGSYWPGGVIYVADYGSEDGALQAAFELLEESDNFRPHIEEWEKELYDEMIAEGKSEEEAMERAYEQARETHDGMVFSVTAKEAYEAISGTDAEEYIDMYLSQGSRGSEHIFADFTANILQELLPKYFRAGSYEVEKTKNSATAYIYHNETESEYTRLYIHINTDDSATIMVENKAQNLDETEFFEFDDLDDFKENIPDVIKDYLKKID